MRFIGQYILKGRMQAVLITCFLTLVSLFLPPLSYLFSGVPVGLVTLRYGFYAGLQIILGSFAVVFVFLWITGLAPQVAIGFLIGIWIPVLICAGILRLTSSQGLMVVTAGLIGLVYIITTHLMISDVPAWWQDWLNTWLIQALPTDQADKYNEVLGKISPLLNAMMACGLVLSVILTTLLSRWWQSLLFNPGGFRKEFYQLQIPWIVIGIIITGLVLVLLGMGGIGSALLDFLALLIFLYLFQGVSLVHRVIAERKLPIYWIYLLYLLLFLIPQTLLFLSCIGIVDSLLSHKKIITNENDKS